MYYWDRFDIMSAYICFFQDYHNGMYCPFYGKQCELTKKYPDLKYRDIYDDSENCQSMYEDLKYRYGFKID